MMPDIVPPERTGILHEAGGLQKGEGRFREIRPGYSLFLRVAFRIRRDAQAFDRLAVYDVRFDESDWPRTFMARTPVHCSDGLSHGTPAATANETKNVVANKRRSTMARVTRSQLQRMRRRGKRVVREGGDGAMRVFLDKRFAQVRLLRWTPR
jgi:hypothetical protein